MGGWTVQNEGCGGQGLPGCIKGRDGPEQSQKHEPTQYKGSTLYPWGHANFKGGGVLVPILYTCQSKRVLGATMGWAGSGCGS